MGLQSRMCDGEGQRGSVLLEELSRSLPQPHPHGDEQQTITGCSREQQQRE